MMCTWHCCQKPAYQELLCIHHFKLTHPTEPPKPPEPVADEKAEFARRPFGSVNGYVHALEIENAMLRRRVRVLEELVSKS